jgi:hypothetical protein
MSMLRSLRRNRVLELAARAGLVGRGVFYLLLAGLAIALLVFNSPRQANANGALAEVSETWVGVLLLAGAAVGFAAFGSLRIVGALTDQRHGRLRRLSTAGQGIVNLGLAAGTAAYVFGARAIGSEDEQRRTAGNVLSLPGGRVLLAAAGVVLLVTCAWQMIVTASGGFADTLDTPGMRRPRRRLVLLTGRVGIPARALAFAPIGIFLIIAAIRGKPAEAKGLDGFLLEMTRGSLGRAVVLLVAIGFVVFAVYSFLEARFRQVSAGA